MRVQQITREGVTAPVTIDPSGKAGPTPGAARGPHWRRVGKGLYVPAAVDASTLDQRIVEAAAGLPAGAAVTGWAALAWTHAKWFDGTSAGRTPLPVPITLPDRRVLKPRPGVLLTEDWLLPGDVIEVDGLPITIPERSVTFETRRARDLVDAVRVIDLAAAADQVSIGSVRSYLERLPGRPGICRSRAAVELADENVWSPMETPLRLAWLDTHPAPLLCNAPVFDAAGNHLFTPDVLDPVAGVGGEYDGLVHVADGVRKRDLTKESRYRDHGIELVTMLNSDLPDLAGFAARLETAYRRSRGASASWTVDQPHWWVDTSTVARRRALTQAERDRWLRWQAA